LRFLRFGLGLEAAVRLEIDEVEDTVSMSALGDLVSEEAETPGNSQNKKDSAEN
jgi:hypothetical protein